MIRRSILGTVLALPFAARAAPAGRSARGLAGACGQVLELRSFGVSSGTDPSGMAELVDGPTGVPLHVPRAAAAIPPKPAPWGWDTLENVR